MKRKTIIAPSLLAADFGRLEQEVKAAEASGADWLHIDVMDGCFVPPITFGTNIMEVCRRASDLPLDVHLMVDAPDQHIPNFISAGASAVTFHLEATRHAHRLLQLIRDSGVKAGVAINPATPVTDCFPVLELCDLILVMTVNPGWGGQKFIEPCLRKVEELATEISKRGLGLHIEVDGGVNAETGPRLVAAGADILVAGSYIFGSKDMRLAIESLRA